MRSSAEQEIALRVTYSTACATIWIIWDTIIHFDVEVECIWKRPKSWVKWTYLFVRYAPILHGGALLALNSNARFSPSGCRGWVYEQLIFGELITFAAEGILVMRLYVLYNHSKIVLGAIIVAFIAEITAMVACLVLVLPKMTLRPDCLVASMPGVFVTFWLASLGFEAFLFILTLFKFFQSVSRSKSSILYIFMRDGTWAFTMIFVVMLLNLLMYKLNKTPLVGVGYGWAFGTMSFAGSHVLLNLRRFALPQDHTKQTLTTLAFGSNSRYPLAREVSTVVPGSNTELLKKGSLEMALLNVDECTNVPSTDPRLFVSLDA